MDDLISRDDAIRALNGACSNWEDDAKVQEIVMAIPSAKPTGDLISRADAIDCCECHGSQECKDRIKALPSADAVQGWIPCSERLPECGFGLHYLVTLKDGHVFMDDVYEAFFDKYGWHVGDNELACDDIIAWMPIPRYEEDSK